VAGSADTQITDLAVDDHACLTFGDPEEQFDLTAAFVRDGLAGGLKVMWLSDENPEQVLAALALRGIATCSAAAAGQMIAAAWEGWCPQARQNRSPGETCSPHDAQRPSRSPHTAQNRSPSCPDAPHCGHATTRHLYRSQAFLRYMIRHPPPRRPAQATPSRTNTSSQPRLERSEGCPEPATYGL
jgi:hypothetical protein